MMYIRYNVNIAGGGRSSVGPPSSCSSLPPSPCGFAPPALRRSLSSHCSSRCSSCPHRQLSARHVPLHLLATPRCLADRPDPPLPCFLLPLLLLVSPPAPPHLALTSPVVNSYPASSIRANRCAVQLSSSGSRRQAPSSCSSLVLSLPCLVLFLLIPPPLPPSSSSLFPSPLHRFRCYSHLRRPPHLRRPLVSARVLHLVS